MLQAGRGLYSDGRAISSMGTDFCGHDNDRWEDIVVTALSNEGFALFGSWARDLPGYCPGGPHLQRQRGAFRVERRQSSFR